MLPARQPTQHNTSVIGIAWFPQNIAIEHNDGVCSDDNTIRRIGASGDSFAPRQQGWVGGQRHRASRQCGDNNVGGRVILLFALEEPEAVAWGDETIWADGRIVGTLTSAAHGHTLGRPVAMGYVACTAGAAAESLLSARYEVDIAGTRVAARPALRAWHDPGGRRLRA